MATSSAKKVSKKKAQSAATFLAQKKSKVRKRKKGEYISPIAIPASLALLLRLIIITVGISTLMGSAIAISNSLNSNLLPKNTTSPTNSTTQTKSANLENLFSLVSFGQENIALTKQIQVLTTKYPQLEAGIFIADLEKTNYVDLSATKIFSSASTIKLPILIAFFQDVDAQKIHLDELLTMTQNNKVDGSGLMQNQPVGTKFTALETVTKMIVVSDNTATNMLIERLGGAAALNKRFAEWGLKVTKINQPLPDKAGTNTTSPEELSNLLIQIDRGNLVSLNSRDRILEIMKQTETNNLLPQGLETGATIAHKTGNIKSVLGDAGIVNLPNGKRYIISVLVKRPDDDLQAQSLIQEISRTANQYFQHSTQFSSSPQKPRSFLTE